MQRDHFVSARQDRWQRLEDLLRRARGRKVARLSGDDLLELGRLYRLATSDLAVARRDFPHDRVTEYLNGLVARIHPLVYQDRMMDLVRVGRFVRYGFPAAYRRAGRYTAIAFALFMAAATVSAILVTYRSSMADILLPGKAQELRSVMEQHHLWMKSATENHSVAANFIMLNNIQVAFIAFAGGVLVGTLTVWVLITNGIVLGTIGAMVAQYGLSEELWSFVVPHGVIELSVIFMAGGAGLMIGDAILYPGVLRRSDSLVRAARDAVHLVAGAVPLLIIAGTIEGFYSPSDAPDAAKFLVGLISGILLYSYLFLSRPQETRDRYLLQDVLSSGTDPQLQGGGMSGDIEMASSLAGKRE